MPVFRVCSAVFTRLEHGGVQVCPGVFTGLLCSIQLSEAVICFAKKPDSDLIDIKRLSHHEFASKSLL